MRTRQYIKKKYRFSIKRKHQNISEEDDDVGEFFVLFTTRSGLCHFNDMCATKN
jgi:hypothetical protein